MKETKIISHFIYCPKTKECIRAVKCSDCDYSEIIERFMTECSYSINGL